MKPTPKSGEALITLCRRGTQVPELFDLRDGGVNLPTLPAVPRVVVHERLTMSADMATP